MSLSDYQRIKDRQQTWPVMPRSPPRHAEQGQSYQSNCIKKEIHAEKTDAPPWLAEPGDWRCGQDALEWISSQYWLILVLRVPHHPFTANLSAWPSWVTSPAATSLPGSSLSAPFLGTTISPSPQPRSYNNRSTLLLRRAQGFLAASLACF
ncbi:hypothetical protein IG631_04459 [Alternaria alternata]|nr:hypothetical protein IG631_04459 [Alternaria alternata]